MALNNISSNTLQRQEVVSDWGYVPGNSFSLLESPAKASDGVTWAPENKLEWKNKGKRLFDASNFQKANKLVLN